MGQKVHPIGFRVGVHVERGVMVEQWRSRWVARKQDFGRLLVEDYKIREYIKEEFKSAGVPRIEISRQGEFVEVEIHTARPGVLVGRKGIRVDQLKSVLEGLTGQTVHLQIKEIKRPELEAALVAEALAEQMTKRIAYRRAIKKAIQTTMQAGAQGVKIECRGRLGGSEMGRVAKERSGRIPLQTLRAHIDYAQLSQRTPAGVIGIKVWIYKGDVTRPQD